MNAVGFCGCPNESGSKRRIGSGNMLWSWNLHGASVPSDEKLAARVLEVFLHNACCWSIKCQPTSCIQIAGGSATQRLRPIEEKQRAERSFQLSSVLISRVPPMCWADFSKPGSYFSVRQTKCCTSCFSLPLWALFLKHTGMSSAICHKTLGRGILLSVTF